MVAYTVLFGWIIVVVVLFSRMKPSAAMIWSVLAGYLLLPTKTGIDLPILPPFDKDFIPSIIALGMVGYLHAQTRYRDTSTGLRTINGTMMLPGIVPREPLFRLLLIVLAVGAFGTALTNGDTQVYGARVLGGLRLYDAFSDILLALTALLPFFLGRKLLAHPDAHIELLRIICIAGLAYSLLALVEVRLSPQLNRWIYGFHPGNWITNLRGGGFRPTVFLQNGLLVAIFFTAAITAAAACIKLGHKAFGFALVWLLFVMVLVKSLGALLIALMFIPVALMMSARMQMIAASFVVICFLSFPLLRTAGFIPVDGLVATAAKIDRSRAASLEFRFRNEDILLDKAKERPVFGWGGWGRGRVYNDAGRDVSITDGVWIIKLGAGGWFKYIAEFGLLTLAVLLLTLRKRRYEISLGTSLLSLVLAGNLIDLIPNAGLTPLTWLIAGALAGRLELRKEDLATDMAAASPKTPVGPQYARPRHGHDPVSGQPQPALSRPRRAQAAAASSPPLSRATQRSRTQ